MGISQYIKDIGRGKDGARPLSREQAADLFGQVLDGSVSDLEVGAFCIAMRLKGETRDEMAGFLDATVARMRRVPAGARPVVVLPSYNGARKLPLLTPLLALLLARAGAPVLIHGARTEASRVFVADVLQALGIDASPAVPAVAPGDVAFVPTALLCPGLQRLLEVRQVIGVRNSAHSLVKLVNPCEGDAVVVGSYTHPEYAVSMGEVFETMGSTAMLLRGTEGEPVADPRRLRRIDGFVRGERVVLEAGEDGPLTELPELPADTSPAATAAYVREVLAGERPVPPPIARQVEHILRLSRALESPETRP